MADALAMEASKGLITEAANGIITAVISRVAEEVKHSWNFERDLKTLEIKLKRIHLLLCGALNSASSNPILDDWLNKVKNVAYDADDLLDVFAFESLKRRVKIESRSVKMSEKLIRYLVDNPIVFRFWMGRRVRELMGAIDGIFGDARELGIKPVEITASNSSASRSVCIADKELDVQREVVSGGSLIGRDDDEAHIVNMLCDPANMKRDLSIFAIVGMAGLGKTALCRRVFYHDQVNTYFEPRIWICVSHDFEMRELLLKMIELVGGNASKALSHQAMLEELAKDLNGKRYLLVLDDVWDTISNVWEPFCGLLLDVGGSKGAAILATSRSRQVVAAMEVHAEDHARTISEMPCIYGLKGLNYDCSWSLFLRTGHRSIDADSALKVIARRMVIKCGGVPLAIKALGNLFKSSSLDWKKIESSEIWKLEDNNGILPPLKLSFIYLPSAAVKNCFAYCAIFPEDAIISRESLIELWMAQGYLQPHDKMELIGNEYFNILLNNSFFQDVEFDEQGNILTCQMHDIVNALAKVVSRQECLNVTKNTGMGNASFDIRHLYLSAYKDIAPQLKRKLRTLIAISLHIHKPYDLLMHAKFLRVLILVCAGITELPDTIGTMKHLRYLDISENDIMVLPNAVSMLYNLQTFKHMCKESRHWSAYPAFPKGLGNLVNLRHIHANTFSCSGFSLRILLENATSGTAMILGQGRRKWGSRITDLCLLNELRGSLAIWQLEYVQSREAARKANLRTKEHIQQLDLAWSYNTTCLTNCDEVLEELQPHLNLNILNIWYYEGKLSPSWLTGLCNLEQMKIFYCRKLKQLPAASVFPFLKVLKVWGCDSLTSFPDSKGLNSLEELRIGRCPMLEVLPSLQPLCNLKVLEIHNCVKMTTLPDGLSDLPNLTTLEVGPLCQDLDYFPFPADLQRASPLSKSLRKLRLTGWPKVRDLPHQLQHLTCVHTLSLGYFDSIKSIPQWLGNLPSLKALEFWHMLSLRYRMLPPEVIGLVVPSGFISVPLC